MNSTNGEWINQDITIQMTGVNAGHNFLRYRFPVEGLSRIRESVFFSHKLNHIRTTKVWRTYTVPQDGHGDGKEFIIRPVDIDKSENVDPDTKYLANSNSNLSNLDGAVELELVSANNEGNDEYYIRSTIDWHYLSIKRPDYWPAYTQPIYFQSDESKALVVRLRKYQRRLCEWREDLQIGSRVLYHEQFHCNGWPRDYCDHGWFEGRIVAFKQHHGFQQEVKVSYSGLKPIHCAQGSEGKMKCTTAREVKDSEWVPIGSKFLCHSECEDVYVWQWQDFAMIESPINHKAQTYDELCLIGMREDREYTYFRKMKAKERQREKQKRKKRENRGWRRKDYAERSVRKMQKYGKRNHRKYNRFPYCS